MIYDIHENPKSCNEISKVLDIKTKEEIRHVFFIDDKEGKEPAIVKRYAVDENGNVIMHKMRYELIVVEERRRIKIIRN